ncbi:MAG: M23 family metallopeptidase [Chloroflexota bacterium]
MQANFNILRSRIFLPIISMIFLSSCQPQVDPITIPSTIPTVQIQLTKTQSFHLTPEATTILNVASQTPKMITSAVPYEQQPCSPLMDHGLEELSQIISQPYDPPPPGSDARHHGLDFFYYQANGQGSIAGEFIQTILPGIVAAVINDRLPYGNMVIIETPPSLLGPRMQSIPELKENFSIYHLYAHMANAPDLSIGNPVTCGQFLGQVGQTGYNVPVPHLHLETRFGPSGQTIGQMAFYDTQATPQENDNYLLWRTSGEFNHFDPMIILAGY